MPAYTLTLKVIPFGTIKQDVIPICYIMGSKHMAVKLFFIMTQRMGFGGGAWWRSTHPLGGAADGRVAVPRALLVSLDLLPEPGLQMVAAAGHQVAP